MPRFSNDAIHREVEPNKAKETVNRL
jgi:hypothetical protein